MQNHAFLSQGQMPRERDDGLPTGLNPQTSVFNRDSSNLQGSQDLPFASGLPNRNILNFSKSDPSQSPKKAWFYPALPWGINSAKLSDKSQADFDMLTRALNSFLAIWEIWTFGCCLWVAGVTPWVMGFSRNSKSECMWVGVVEYLTHKDTRIDIAWKQIAFAIDLVVDLTFFLDIIFTFHSALWVISTQGTPHWVNL
jgi:hypothetical protein